MTNATSPAIGSDAAFQVTVQPSGRSFCAPTQESILAAAISQGIGLPYGCKDGACGSCKCQKISGTVEHGPHQEKALSEQELQAGWILTCCAHARSDVVLQVQQVTDERAYPVKKMPVRVICLEKKSPDVMLVQLQLPTGSAFKYHAGQYVEFVLAGGVRRAYSLARAPHHAASDMAIELHIRHMPGGLFTDQVFTGMKAKDILRIEGPFGSFYLRENSDKPLILLASGTGFAPIKALIEQLQHQGSIRPMALYWGARRKSDLYLHDWVQAKVLEMPQLHYVPVLSEAQPQDDWTGRTGLVHEAVLEDFEELSGFEVYACGAPIVVESARASYTTQRNLPLEAFFADAFTSERDKHVQSQSPS